MGGIWAASRPTISIAIRSNVTRMEHLVTDISDMSKIQSGRMRMDPKMDMSRTDEVRGQIEELFDQILTEENLAWLDEHRAPYVFAHQPENRESPRLARRFHAAVRHRRPEVAAG